jgi:hypothetical protein
MPAPAPCATTKQALESGAELKSPETRVVALTSIAMGLESALFTLALRQRPAREVHALNLALCA